MFLKTDRPFCNMKQTKCQTNGDLANLSAYSEVQKLIKLILKNDFFCNYAKKRETLTNTAKPPRTFPTKSRIP